MLILHEESLVRLEQALMAHRGNLTRACRDCGFPIQEVAKWIARDPDTAERIRAAQTTGWEALEDIAYTRAVEGVQEPVYQRGELAGYITKYSDPLLIKMMQARIPAYAHKESSTPGTVVNVAVMPRASSYEEWVVQRDRELEKRTLDKIEEAEYEEVPTVLKDIL